MKRYFTDTVYYIALANPQDELHEVAVRCTRDLKGLIVTSEYILLELGNHLSGRNERAAFVQILRRIRLDPNTEVVPCSRHLFDIGFNLFASRPDKDWSLTDCISFVVMERHGLAEALTADHHFEQAGFKPLL